MMQSMLMLAMLSGSAQAAPVQSSKGGLTAYAPAGATDVVVGKRYALVIGIDAYEDDSFHDLRFAVADALAMAEALRDFDEVVLLTTPEQTTHVQMTRAMADLMIKATGPTDTVLVYVSSHGTLDRWEGGSLERFIVNSDAVSSSVHTTSYSVGGLIAQMEGIPARRKGIILATCYNGKEKSALSSPLAAELASYKGTPPLMDRSEAMIVTSAASWGEAALENEELGHDVYTHFLLESLTKGDRDANGAVTLSEAHDYARERTFAFTNGLQRPSARAVILGADPIVLTGKPDPNSMPVLYSYDDVSDGLSLLFDGTVKGTLPGSVPVEPGVHKLEVKRPDGTVLASETVSIEAGQRYSLAQLVVPTATWSVRPMAGGLIPLGSQDVWPTGAGGGVAAEYRLARTAHHVQLNASVMGGGKDTKVTTGMASVGVGVDLMGHPNIQLSPVISAGLALNQWRSSLGFDRGASGPTSGLGLRFAARPSRHIELVVEPRAGAMLLDFGGDNGSIQPFGLLYAGVGWVR